MGVSSKTPRPGVSAPADESERTKRELKKTKDMERPNYEERLEIIQPLIDRLLYLEEKDLKEFMNYIDALYEAYPVPRKILYGAAAMRSKEGLCK